jgi:rRNA maturation endonuclease Nob1
LPDLKPFATATASVATDIKQGGDLTLAPLAQAPALVKGELVLPGEPNHPARQLTEAWDKRRHTADAIVAYSAALAAISDASAKRQANAEGLVKSVNALANTVTGANALSDAASALASKVVATVAEVKADRDLSAAVQSADPAIQEIAHALQLDFQDLAKEYKALETARLVAAVKAFAPVDNFYSTVKAQRDQQRTEVAKAVGDVAKGAELSRLEALVAGAESDWQARRTERDGALAALATGQDFFTKAGAAIGAWAEAHHALAATLKEKRPPDLIVLLTRAQELRTLVAALKTSK